MAVLSDPLPHPQGWWRHLALIDHHSHAWSATPLSLGELASRLTEAVEGPWGFDTLLGMSFRRWCAPVLDLAPRCPPADYAERRAELGPEEVGRRFVRAAGLDALLVDTGVSAPGLLDLSEVSRISATPVHQILRLESLAEEVMTDDADPAQLADRFADRLAAALADRLAGDPPVVACKSIAAYRHGLDLDPARPSPSEVREAAAAWLARPVPGGPGPARLVHPVILRHLLWSGIDAGLPLQIHTGMGDVDEDLHRCDPSLLTPFLRASAAEGTPVMLLHCYPYHRHAAYLASVFPHVYLDVGLAGTFVGHRLPVVLAETLELAPFTKLLYASDAFGLAELHYLSAVRFREALVQALEPLRSTEGFDHGEIGRLAGLIGSGNAQRVYSLAARSPEPDQSRQGR